LGDGDPAKDRHRTPVRNGLQLSGIADEQGAGEAELKTMETEILKLDQEVQQMAAKSEEDLVNKQQALLEPVLKKLQDAIDDIAAARSYDYILNQTTSAGVSTILFGPEEADITKDLFTKLGMKMPTE
jgi:outer membrane protein